MSIHSLPDRLLHLRPKVLSVKDVEKSQPTPDFKMYDAVPATEEPLAMDNSEDMDKFLPMLNYYLKSVYFSYKLTFLD